MVKHSAYEELPELEDKRWDIFEAKDFEELKKAMFAYAQKNEEVLLQLANDTWRIK